MQSFCEKIYLSVLLSLFNPLVFKRQGEISTFYQKVTDQEAVEYDGASRDGGGF
jgi:hypothetical protein